MLLLTDSMEPIEEEFEINTSLMTCEGREQTQIWMDDYNPQRPHDALGKLAPIEYAKINALLKTTNKTKNNNFIPSSSSN